MVPLGKLDGALGQQQGAAGIAGSAMRARPATSWPALRANSFPTAARSAPVPLRRHARRRRRHRAAAAGAPARPQVTVESRHGERLVARAPRPPAGPRRRPDGPDRARFAPARTRSPTRQRRGSGRGRGQPRLEAPVWPGSSRPGATATCRACSRTSLAPPCRRKWLAGAVPGHRSGRAVPPSGNEPPSGGRAGLIRQAPGH